jgi:cyanate permease
MKRLNAAKHPVTRCTPFKFWIGPMLVIEEIFFGFALMPRSEMVKPSSILLGIPKTHFLGLSLIFLARKHLNASSRSATRLSFHFDLTMMSST